MKRSMRAIGIVIAMGLVMTLSGCIYDPGYYHRSGVVYSDGRAAPAGAPVDANGNAAVDYDDDADDGGYAYAPGYYYPGYYNAWPYFGLGLGFYGGYYCCGRGYHGPWRHGYYPHGGPHGGWAGRGGGSGGHGGGHSSSSGGHSSSGHH